MPSAILRPCPGDGGRCPELVPAGRCARHARQIEQRRGSAASRGYGSSWVWLRQKFREAIIRVGIAPVCGAKLPGAPVTPDSRCAAEGLVVGDGPRRGLHVDHIVPHRGDPVLFKDLNNLQYLCHGCHSAKTLREQQA
jgi:5-methylcytosine-specific restriction protein A